MDRDTIVNTVVELLRRAHTGLPIDIVGSLEREAEQDHDGARTQLKLMLENLDLARREGTPMCEDTGYPVFYLDLGRVDAPLDDITTWIREGMALATETIPLRPSTVHPLTRENKGDNTGIGTPPVHVRPIDGDHIQLTVLPKGAGSENMSALKILTPADGVACIKRFVLDTIVEIGANPCPPLIIGVGIGGTSDMAMSLAKRALLRGIDTYNPDIDASSLESELRLALRDLGYGPMGLGGKPSVIGVNIEIAHCHTTALPVGLNIQCWCGRRATARIERGGKVRFLEG